MRRDHGPGGRLGQKKWRVGDHPPMQEMRAFKFIPGGGRRLSHEADVDCDETTLPTTVPIGKNRGNDRSHGRRWTVISRIKADTINPNILLDNDFEYGIMGHRRRTYHRRDKAG